MDVQTVDVLVPSAPCLRHYRKRVLGIPYGFPFDHEERRVVRKAVVNGLASAIEVDHDRHPVLAKAINVRPGRRYFRSGDVMFVVDGAFVISVFRFSLNQIATGCFVIRPCLAVYAEKVLGLDLSRIRLDRALAARITTMIIADVIQSEARGRTDIDDPVFAKSDSANRYRMIQDRMFVLTGEHGGWTVVKSVFVGRSVRPGFSRPDSRNRRVA